jgi:hypothetical protein
MVTQGSNVKYVWLNLTPGLMNNRRRTWAAERMLFQCAFQDIGSSKEGDNTPIGASPDPSEKVIYSLHGDRYLFASASPDVTHSTIVHALLKHCEVVQRIFAV